MAAESRAEANPSVSVVIPSFNSAPWLPATIEAVATSLKNARLEAEIVVVDDGSTDATLDTLESIRDTTPFALNVVSQPNAGRFGARVTGVTNATFSTILLLDSRVLVHPQALLYVREQWSSSQSELWNGHIEIDKATPLVGRFWEVPTHVFWAEYLANPRPVTIDSANFDRLPKGTGLFIVPKELFLAACAAAFPDGPSPLASDDTRVLRHLVAGAPIRLEPGFSGTYLPRTSVKGFLSHAFDRGTLFVDSYAGTSVLRNVILVLLAIAPWLVLAGVVALVASGLVWALVALLAVGIVALAVPATLAAVRRCPGRALLAYGVFVVPFAVVFAAGLSRGLIVHRKALVRADAAVEFEEGQGR